MSDEENLLIKEKVRGNLAEQIMTNPVWNDAWSVYKQGIMEQWERTPVAAKEDRETLWVWWQQADKVRSAIEEIFQTGKMAAMQLQRMEKNG